MQGSSSDLEDGARAQHSCSSTGFAEFPDAALETSLVDRFREQVALHGDCLAVIEPGRALTYGELDAWANGIAQSVLDATDAGGEPVALVLAQGASSCAAILGALKAGRTYVSLDPSDPRRARAAREVGARTILTDRAHVSAAVPVLDGSHPLVVDEIGPAADPRVQVTADSVAYVFFTSGSTGEPKGVYDCHRNVLHNVLRYTNSLRISPSDRLSLIQSPSFSGCVSSLFSALLNGAAVAPFSIDEQGVRALGTWLGEQRVSIYHSVPSIFRSLLRGGAELGAVRVVRLEGDRASAQDVELFRQHFGSSSVLVNGLGTTETGIARQLFVRPDTAIADGVLPVGYPVRDMQVLVVGDDGVELPSGSPGEIVVRSRYLALGYWERPDLTNASFAADGDERVYRTRDLGRFREDGCLEYLGRKDGELKVLGHRVEPAEVEAELVRLPGVREAAVTTREGLRGDARLVAYVVSEDVEAPPAGELRRALALRLPAHMIPSSVVSLPELPLGPTGKVDRTALPDPVAHVPSRAPADDDEQLIGRIWESVLGISPIGAEDDFFELGGDSLAAAEVLAQLEVETGRSLPLSILAGTPTVARLAEALRAPPGTGPSSLVVLRSGGDRAPIVLLHGNTGNSLHYAALVDLLPASHPVWALEDTLPLDEVGVEPLAARHVATLEAARPSGSFVLAGFCYGAALAHEIACRLRRARRDVELLVLLGVTPLEFPTLLAPDAYRRSQLTQGSRSFLARARMHLAQARTLPANERLPYLAERASNLLRRVSRLDDGHRRSPWIAVQEGLAAHRPDPYPGGALLVLHAGDSSAYTDDPGLDWAGLTTEEPDVEVLPGHDHAMLEEPGVQRLATVLAARLATCP